MHKLLERQLKRYLGDSTAMPDSWRPFLEAVGQAYEHFDSERLIRDRAIELSSHELFAANASERRRAQAAEDLASLRSEFVATVSHELRSPLTAIIGYGELLESRWDQFSEQDRRDRVRRIVASAHRQRQLVEDLLLVSRIENGDLVARRTVVALPLLVQQAMEEVRANYKGQHFDLIGPETLTALADPSRLVQILVNVVDNAVKYSPEGSPVEIAWSRQDIAVRETEIGTELWVVVRVRDHGRGLAAEGRERLFERFGRLNGSPTRRGRVGTGLGLYLSRRLARAMGGDLDVEATGCDGTVFRLVMPAEVPMQGGGQLTDDVEQAASE
jgi:signal transduction histidine kinase